MEKILVVDDNYENLRVIGGILREKNYDIAMATSGEDAIEILETNDIDLIFLDILMPGINGFETCRLIKKNPNIIPPRCAKCATLSEERFATPLYNSMIP